MSKDIMVDIESLDVKPGAIILSIGAVDVHDFSNTFYSKISVEDSIGNGFHSSKSTSDWWKKQPIEVYQEAISGTKTNVEVANELAAWIKQVGSGDVNIWGNGALMDNAILIEWYNVLGIPLPWTYKQDRCFRTIKAEFGGEYIDEIEFTGDKHNALADAIHQAKQLRAIFNMYGL